LRQYTKIFDGLGRNPYMVNVHHFAIMKAIKK